MSDPVESLRAMRKRRPWADGGTCPSCHDAYHGNRPCGVTIYDGKDRVGHEPGYGFCPCTHREEALDVRAALVDLTAALDEPLVIFGGKTTREMLGGRGA